MGPVRAEIEVDAPREAAFAFVGDLANRPAFTDHFMSDFRLLGTRSSGVGAGARFRFFAAPQAVWTDTVVEEISPPHRMTERGRGGRGNRVPSTTVWEVEPGPGPLCTVRVVHWTSPDSPIDRVREAVGLASRWYERNWALALRRLRDLLESGAALPAGVGVAGGDRLPAGVP